MHITAKKLVPDSFEGFPVRKEAIGKIYAGRFGIALLLGYGGRPEPDAGRFGICYGGRPEPVTPAEEPATPLPTGQSTSTRQVNFVMNSINPSSISFDTSHVGTSNLSANNKTLPNIQDIGITSRMAKFFLPPMPKMPEFPAITQPQPI